MSSLEYKPVKELMKVHLCDTCGETYGSRSAYLRHHHSKHLDKPCLERHCWTCGITYKRKDVFTRHLNTKKHLKNAETFQMDSTTQVYCEDWYSYMHTIEKEDESTDTEMPPPMYKPSTYIQNLRTDAAIIPLENTVPQEDSRLFQAPPNGYFYTINEHQPTNIQNQFEDIISTENLNNVISEISQDPVISPVSSPEYTEMTTIHTPDFTDMLSGMTYEELTLLNTTLNQEVDTIDTLLDPPVQYNIIDEVGNTDSDVWELLPPADW